MISPCTIEHMINAGADSDVDLVFSSFKSISSSNVELNDCNNGLKKVYSREELQKIFLLRKVVVLAPGTLYKRSFLINNDLKYKKIPWSEDQHFVWRVLALLNKAIYLDEIWRFIGVTSNKEVASFIYKIFTKIDTTIAKFNYFCRYLVRCNYCKYITYK